MPYTKINPLTEVCVQHFDPVGGTPTGSRTKIVSPVRGRLVEAGFMPNSLVASAVTMRVNVGNNSDPTASAFTEVITSTLGTFASTNLVEGACASASPPSPAYVNIGDAVDIVTSGGNTSAIGFTKYAIFRKG